MENTQISTASEEVDAAAETDSREYSASPREFPFLCLSDGHAGGELKGSFSGVYDVCLGSARRRNRLASTTAVATGVGRYIPLSLTNKGPPGNRCLPACLPRAVGLQVA